MDDLEVDDELETEDFDELDEGDEPEELEVEEPSQEEEVEEEPPARKPSRAQARIEALDRERQEALRRAEEAERRLQEAQSGRSRSDAEARYRARQEELAAMDPWDRARAEQSDSESRTRSEVAALSRQIADSSDRADFAEACASNPALAKVKDKVEEQLRDARARGVDVPRRTLAAYILGEQLLEKAPKARARAERKAAANLDRERSRPASGASDAPRGGEGKDEKAARNKRLENYTF